MTPVLTPYQKNFVDFLVGSGSLSFGDFITKSGRNTPYFVNTGNFDSGSKIAQLGGFYAEHIISNLGREIDVIFGPAYKGIPLCVATSMALANKHNLNIGFAFDRKEAKEHGDKGKVVGKRLSAGARVVIVEDVITAGTTLREIVPVLRSSFGIEISGVVVSVDRCERGTGRLSAVQELESDLGIKIFPIVSIRQVIEYLSRANDSGVVLNNVLMEKIEKYLEQYAG